MAVDVNELDQTALETLAHTLGEALLARREKLTTAESCTGGWVSSCLTANAGASLWFERGFVTYSNDAKHELLGVDAEILSTHGAVSEAVARAMAAGALAQSRADWSLAITGIAGPGGGSDEKPVGTVWFAWGEKTDDGIKTSARMSRFDGDRESIRRQSVAYALCGLLLRLQDEAAPEDEAWE